MGTSPEFKMTINDKEIVKIVVTKEEKLLIDEFRDSPDKPRTHTQIREILNLVDELTLRILFKDENRGF